MLCFLLTGRKIKEIGRKRTRTEKSTGEKIVKKEKKCSKGYQPGTCIHQPLSSAFLLLFARIP